MTGRDSRTSTFYLPLPLGEGPGVRAMLFLGRTPSDASVGPRVRGVDSPPTQYPHPSPLPPGEGETCGVQAQGPHDQGSCDQASIDRRADDRDCRGVARAAEPSFVARGGPHPDRAGRIVHPGESPCRSKTAGWTAIVPRTCAACAHCPSDRSQSTQMQMGGGGTFVRQVYGWHYEVLAPDRRQPSTVGCARARGWSGTAHGKDHHHRG